MQFFKITNLKSSAKSCRTSATPAFYRVLATIFAIFTFFATAPLMAFDPELAATQSANPTGLGVGLKGHFGPVFFSGSNLENVEDGKLGFIYGAEPTFQLSSTSRSRLEGQLFLGQGLFTYEVKTSGGATESTDVSLPFIH